MDIVSVQTKNNTSDFSYAKTYFKEVFGINLILYIIFIISFELTFNQKFISFLVIISFSFLTLYLIGIKRRKAIEKIEILINQIKNNKSIPAEEIKLNTHLKKIENDLREMHKKNQNDIENIKRLAQTRSDFLGNVSHELRTPIFTIQGFLETLLNGAINDPQVNKKFLKKAIHHTHNLNSLLNDLIDISMIETGEMRMQPVYFNISKFIKKIVDELEPFATEKEIKIKTKFFDKNAKVFGDKNRLKQTFVNLINNAIKYSEKGNIVVGTSLKDDKIEIFVKDSGIGLSEVEISRIFERFYRVDKARSKELGGTGLGLAIVKHIVEAHGSQIIVKSKKGKGSTFSFTLRSNYTSIDR